MISHLAQAIGTFFPWSVAKTPWLFEAYADLHRHIVQRPQQVIQPACISVEARHVLFST